jgi:hypothetical protein
MSALKLYRLGVGSAPAEGSHGEMVRALARQAERYHYASLQDQNLVVAARHNAYASGILGVLTEESTEAEVLEVAGINLKDLRRDVYKMQDILEGKAFKQLPGGGLKEGIEAQSPWLGEEKTMFHRKGPWLGQIPLILGPSSWGAGMMPTQPARPLLPEDYENDLAGRRHLGAQGGLAPYYGQWGLADGSSSGQEGPFDTVEEAFSAAVSAVQKAGAKMLPNDGFAQVVDSKGQAVGPIT